MPIRSCRRSVAGPPQRTCNSITGALRYTSVWGELRNYLTCLKHPQGPSRCLLPWGNAFKP